MQRLVSLRAGIAFLAPAVLVVGLFMVVPSVWVVAIAFTNEQLLGPHAINFSFVGLQNFAGIFNFAIWMQPGQFGWALRNTVIFVLACVAIQTVLGLLLAAVLHRRRGVAREIFVAVVIVAWVAPDTVVAFCWFAFLDQNAGTLNAILGLLHLPQSAWLVEHPLLSIIMFNSWRGAAFSLLVYSGAFASLPTSNLEAASVIGASSWQAFRQVLLPQITSHLLIGLLLNTLATFNTFGPFLLTQGGPSYESETIPIFVWRTAFQNYDIGSGAAVAIVMLLVNVIVASGYVVALRRQA
jgi:multiple sugar transport system permease protein